MQNSHRRSLIFATASVALTLIATHPAQAQAGPRWRAWLGCWTAVTPPAGSTSSTTSTTQPSPMLCVTPTSDADVVEISAISDGKVLSRDRLDASGRAQTVDAGGCTGTTRANWSSDQRRVFLRSNVTCQDQPSETSAILAMTGNNGGEWLDVRSVSAGGNSEVRVARYRDAGVPSGVPSDIASALRDRELSMRSARVASIAQIGTQDIVEASRSADPAIVEAWLMESGQTYAVDASTLRQLADAGVPGRVTDAMVSASRHDGDARYAADDDRGRERVVAVYDPWGYGLTYRPAPYPVVVRYRPHYYYAPVGFSFSLFGFGYAPYGYAYAPFGYYPYYYRPAAYVPFGLGFGYSHAIGRSYRPPVVYARPGRPQPSDPRTAHPRNERDVRYTAPTREQRHDDGSSRGVVERATATERGYSHDRTSSTGRQQQQHGPPPQPRSNGGDNKSAHRRP